MLDLFKWSNVGIFAGGILFATKGVELLKSRGARDVFVKATALGVRNRDDVMKCVTSITSAHFWWIRKWAAAGTTG